MSEYEILPQNIRYCVGIVSYHIRICQNCQNCQIALTYGRHGGGLIKGPKLYNDAATKFNRSLDNKKLIEPLFQNKFTKPFKRTIKNKLLASQFAQDPDEWHTDNFLLYI